MECTCMLFFMSCQSTLTSHVHLYSTLSASVHIPQFIHIQTSNRHIRRQSRVQSFAQKTSTCSQGNWTTKLLLSRQLHFPSEWFPLVHWISSSSISSPVSKFILEIKVVGQQSAKALSHPWLTHYHLIAVILKFNETLELYF